MAKKKKGPPQVSSGNYFPSIEIGLKNNYIYYISLLSGDDEQFAMNRVIGKEAQNYLNNIHLTKLNPNFQDSAVDKAINFLMVAANNERRKELEWLRKTCEVLEIDFPSDPENANFIEIIKILNEAQKGTEQAYLQIRHEAERWSAIDIERVLSSKELQQKYANVAKRFERKAAREGKNYNEEIQYYNKLAEDLYWGTKGRAGRPTDQKQIMTIARSLGEISKRANKLFTGSGRSFAEKAEKKLLPYVTKALKINLSTNKVDFNVAIIQTVLRELLMWIIEQIVTEDLKERYITENGTTKNFLNSNSKERMKRFETALDTLDEKTIEDKVEALILTNSYMDSLNIPAEDEQQKSLKESIKQSDKDAERIMKNILDQLAKDEREKQAYRQEKNWKSKAISSNNKEFRQWLADRYQLNNALSKTAINEAITSSIRQTYYYSEERTIQEAIEQMIGKEGNTILGKGYRPKGNPKVDSILGYFNYELEYDNTPIQEKQKILTGLQKELIEAQEEMDSILQKAYDHSKDSQKNLWIRREASIKDYTHNTQAFEEIRRQQLAKLETLANSIAKKEQGAKAILTQYNVLTTVKDQSGLLDTFIPGTKMRERGIGFSGGAMGKDNNGFSVIDNILAMGKKAHILDVKDDAEWLKFALINSGLGLLGFKNRSSLENYFSLFASYLMFDDAQLMISQALAESAQEIGKTNSVQEIHLYVINGVYIPQSYILEELYKHMQEIKANGNFYKRNLSESTVRTQIYGYNVGSKYPGNTEEDWRRESDNAIKQTKIKMYYMMNFADLVNQLSELMSKNF